MDLNLIKLDKPPQLTLKPGFSRDSFTRECMSMCKLIVLYDDYRTSLFMEN